MSPLELANLKRQQQKDLGLVEKRRDAFQQARDSPKSKALAIKAHCLDCCGEEVITAKSCDMVKCYLYNVNPWRV